jgi:hypothetical protein
MVLAVAWLVFAFLFVMTWHVPSWGRFVPLWLSHAIYPIDKTDMDPARVLHFLALLILIARFLPRNSAAFPQRSCVRLFSAVRIRFPSFASGYYANHALFERCDKFVLVGVGGNL